MSEGEDLFSWLHLSDLHFGHGSQGWSADQKILTEQILEDVRRRSFGPRVIDAIFVTGDIAFSGAAEEYEMATRWFGELCDCARVDPKRLFLIPGNHDVNMRSDKELRVQRMLDGLHGGDSIDECLKDEHDDQLIRRRFREYLAFSSGFATKALFWNMVVHGRQGLAVRVAGMNTALVCARGSDKGRLQVGVSQPGSTVATQNKMSANEILLALTHHPLDWLAPKERDRCIPMFQRFVDIHLFGHTHEHEGKVTEMRGASLISINAGAAHLAEDASRHRYNIASVQSIDNEGALRIRLWPRVWSSKGFRFVVDNENIDDEGSRFVDYPLGRRVSPARFWLDQQEARCGDTVVLRAMNLPAGAEFDVMLMGASGGFGVCKIKTDECGGGVAEFQVPYMDFSGKFIRPGKYKVSVFCGGSDVETILEVSDGDECGTFVRKPAVSINSDSRFGVLCRLCIRWGYLDVRYSTVLFLDVPSVSFSGIQAVLLRARGNMRADVMLSAESSSDPSRGWLPLQRTMSPLRPVRGVMSFRLNRPLSDEQLAVVISQSAWEVKLHYTFAVELFLSTMISSVHLLTAEEVRRILGVKEPLT
ncbi:MAG: metallophosphoesterase [Myxococcales bacterium]|nr:metallophosphoesterase [Myxococcales bacterium]